MSTTKDAPQSGQVTGKVVSAGPAVRADVIPRFSKKEDLNAGDDGAGGTVLTDEQKLAAEKAAADAAAAGGTQLTDEQKAALEAEKNKLPEISDDQLKALLKTKGIEVDDKGFDGLKEKLTKPAEAAKSPEDIEREKKEASDAFDKRMLDFFLQNGGKVEDFVALKKIASADLKELSQSEIVRELKENGFDDAEINAVLKERYYQINPEELVRDEDNETEEEFEARKKQIEKKIAYGSKKLESKASPIKKQAEDALSQLREAIKNQDLQQTEEANLSSKVDEVAKTLPRKMTFELGKVNDQEIPPVDYDVTEDDIAEVVSTLKDPGKRNNILYNTDNSLNINSVAGLLLKNKILESALKATYLEGGNRQVAAFEKRFPGRTAKDIGVGGAAGANGRKGHIVSAGQPERVR